MDREKMVMPEESNKRETVRDVVRRTAKTLSEAAVKLHELTGSVVEEERKESSVHCIVDELEIDVRELARLAADVNKAAGELLRRL